LTCNGFRVGCKDYDMEDLREWSVFACRRASQVYLLVIKKGCRISAKCRLFVPPGMECYPKPIASEEAKVPISRFQSIYHARKHSLLRRISDLIPL
jgi:hypothetical protein